MVDVTANNWILDPIPDEDIRSRGQAILTAWTVPITFEMLNNSFWMNYFSQKSCKELIDKCHALKIRPKRRTKAAMIAALDEYFRNIVDPEFS